MKKFRSITLDQTLEQKVHFCNPFEDGRYEKCQTRRDLVKAWKEECRIREAELQLLYNIRQQH
jgi:hypothetical protein